jgi:hypothetical protein
LPSDNQYDVRQALSAVSVAILDKTKSRCSATNSVREAQGLVSHESFDVMTAKL